MAEQPTLGGEWCKRCDRRVCIGFSVPDPVWDSAVRGRWNVVCAPCFDEEAEIAGVAYSFGPVSPVSWSEWKE